MPEGNYKIRNIYFDTQYADLVNGDPTDGTKVIGHHDDDSVAGIDHRTFALVDIDEELGIVTLQNKASGTYATINQDKQVVEGGSKQELQLIRQGLGQNRFLIQVPYENIVWVLGNADDWTQICAMPALPYGSEGSERQYWKFERV